ncbi:MAG: Shedu anti-phage system protein SduA domain-containing protein [Bacteroidota bacterium]
MPLITKNFNQLFDEKNELMNYADYLKDSIAGLKTLVSNQEKSSVKDELAVQKYFEQHPSTLLGVLCGVSNNSKIEGNLIISQPRIKSLARDRQPDFLIITGNSLQLFFNFIEIEAPAKKIFHERKYELSKDFFQSYSQLTQWRSFEHSIISDYCSFTVNTLFGNNGDFKVKRKHYYNFIMLYGNSDEVLQKNDPTYTSLLLSQFKDEIQHVTYSRLISDPIFHRPLITIKRRANVDQFEAIGMDPIKYYDYWRWSNHHNISGKQALIKKTTYLNDDEKDVLIEKITAYDKLSSEEILKLENRSY